MRRSYAGAVVAWDPCERASILGPLGSLLLVCMKTVWQPELSSAHSVCLYHIGCTQWFGRLGAWVQFFGKVDDA